MNKLVSRNPVLRFKLGRKIVKALWGLRTRDDGVIVNAVGTPVGRSIRESSYEYEKGFPEDKLILNGLYLDAYSGDIFSPNNKDSYGDYNQVLPGPSPILNGTYYETKDNSGKIIEKGRYFGGKKHPLPIGGNSNKSKSEKQQSSTAKSSTTVKPKPRSGWSYGYNRSNEISDIKATQQMLKDAGYLSSNKYNVVDGKWGKDTENAYKKYLLNKEKPVVAPVLTEIPLIAPLLAQTTLNQAPKTLTNFTSQPITRTFNRSGIRDYIRSKGKGAYDYTGDQRRALRMVMNGQGTDEDKAIVLGMGLFKTGGQLVSRNPITRFKNKKK